MKISIELTDLKDLLNQQKRNVIEKLLSQNYVYNSESTESNLKSMNIDKSKFGEVGMTAQYPNDFEVLQKYIK